MRPARWLTIALVAGCSVFASSRAADLFWDSDPANGTVIDDGSGTWDLVSTNWHDGVGNLAWVNGAGDVANLGNAGVPGTITVNGTIVVGTLNFRPLASGTYTLTGGALDLSGGLVTLETNATILSALVGTNFTKVGVQDLFLGGDNSALAGTVTLSTGRVLFVGDNAGSTGATWSVAIGTQLGFFNSDGLPHSVRLGAIAGTAGAKLLATGTGTGGTTIVLGEGGANSTFSGTLTNGALAGQTLSLVKAGTGTVTLSGTGIGHHGSNYVAEGRLTLSDATSFANSTSSASFFIAPGATLEFAVSGTHKIGSVLTNTIAGGGTLLKTGSGLLALDEQGNAVFKTALRMTGGVIDVQGGAIRNGGWQGQIWADSISTNQAVLNLGASGMFDIWDGISPWFGALTGTGLIDKNSGNGGVNTLNVGVNNGSGSFSGTMRNTQTFLALAKHGLGTQILAGANIRYTGNTTVNAGVLRLENTTNFASGSMAINALVELELSAGNNLRFAGGSSGTGTLRKTGSGELVLSGSNLRMGPTTLEAGTIVISNTALSGPLTISNGATAVAIGGTGLLGVFYNVTNGPGAGVNPNFVSPTAVGLFLATNNVTVMEQTMVKGANFDMLSGFPTPSQDHLVGRWLGKFNATTSGVYTFITGSDDGSLLWIDGTNVVSNNFYQGVTERSGTIALTAGLHDIGIAYYEHAGGNNVYAKYLLPGSTVTNMLANALLASGPGVGTLSGDSGSLLIVSNGQLAVAQNADSTMAGTITGPGGLIKYGTGTLSLAGGSYTLTDRVTAASGTLRIDGSLPNAPAQAIVGGTIGGNGSIAGTATAEEYGSVNAAAPGTIGLLTLGGLAIRPDGVLAVDVNATTADVVNIAGALTISNGFVDVQPSAPLATGSTYVIGSYGSRSGTFAGARNLNPGIGGTRSLYLTYPAGQIVLNVGERGTLRWSGTPANLWDRQRTAAWTNLPTGTPELFNTGDTVLFDDTPGVATNVVVATANSPAAVLVDNAVNGFVFSGTGRVTGAASLAKSGAGTLTISTTNDFTGPVTVSGGVVRLNATGALGSNSSVTVLAGGQVQIAGVSQAGRDYKWTIAGSGPDGSGAIMNTNVALSQSASVRWLTLSGDAAIGAWGAGTNETGRWDVGLNGGVDGGGFTLTKVGNSVINFRGGATNLQLVVAAGMAYTENVTNGLGTNVIVQAGATLGAYGTATNPAVPVTLNGGTLASRNGAGPVTWSGPVTLAADSFMTTAPGYGYPEELLFVSGVVSGPGRLTKQGTVSVHLRNDNTYSGGTVISAGNLVLGSNTPSGSVLGWITNNANLYFWRSDAYTMSNAVTGTGNIYIRSAGGHTIDGTGSINVGGSLFVGQDQPGLLLLQPGAIVSASSLYVGNPANITGAVVQTGGTVAISGSGTPARLAHYAGETSVYSIASGQLLVTNGALSVGWDGTGFFTQSGGTVKVARLQLDANGTTAGTDSYNLTGGLLSLGAAGLDAQADGQFNFGGGTLSAFASWQSTHPLNITGTNGNAQVDGAGYAITLTGPLTGTGGLAKTGSGSLIMAGTAANTYSGGTIVNGGTLVLNKALAGAGGITVNNGGTLSGTGTNTAGAVVANAGGTLQPGFTGLPVPLTATGVTLAAGSIVAPLSGGTGAILRVSGTDGLTLPTGADTALINVASATLPTGTYTVIDYAGALQGGTVAANLVLGAKPPRATMALVDNPGNTTIDLIISGYGAIKWTGATDSQWNINTTTNWTDTSPAPTAYLETAGVGDAVLFDDTAAQFAVNVATPVAPASITISGSSNYTFSGAAIGGAGGFTMNVTGKVTLASSNAFAGPVVVSGGTLSIDQDANLGAAPVAPVANQIVLGAGATLELRAAATIHSNRAIAVGSPGVATAATVDHGTNTVIVQGAIANAAGATGTLRKVGGGQLQLLGAASYSGGTRIEAGTLQIGNGGTGASIGPGPVVNNGVLWFRKADDLSFGGAISGTGDLIHAGAGRLGLTVANTFTGTIYVTGAPVGNTAAWFCITADTQLGAVSNLLVLDGGGIANMNSAFGNPGGSLTLNAARNVYLGPSNGAFRTGYTYNTIVNGTISGPGKLLKTDGNATGGALILNNANTFTNNTQWIDVGVGYGLIRLGHTNALQFSTVVMPNVNNAVLDLNGLDNVTLGGLSGGGATQLPIGIPGGKTLRVGNNNQDTVYSGGMTGGALTKIGSGRLTIASSLLYTGITTVAAGTLEMGAGGKLYNGGLYTSTVYIAGGAALRLSVSDVFGVHSNQPNANVQIEQGGLVVNTNIFNTLANLRMNGGELRVGGGSSATFQAYQLRGTVTVAGAAASWISLATNPANAFLGIQLGDNTTNGTTTFDVADAAAGADLRVDAPLVDGRGSDTGFTQVASGLIKTGPGTLELNATNTYASRTVVSNGAVWVNGIVTLSRIDVLSGATLGGRGLVQAAVTNAGTIAPGTTTIGQLALSAGVAMQSGATLAIELNGLAPGTGHDRLAVTGTAALNGALAVTNLTGYVPLSGQTYTVLTATAVSGTFATTNLTTLGAGLGWNVTYPAGAVVLSVTGAPALTGFNLYVSGITNGLTGYSDDADGDGFANLLEYVTGGNPTNADLNARMNGGRTNGVLALKFLRDTAATDATIYVEGSYTATNGAAWTGIATNLAGSWGGSTNVSESGPSPVNVTVQDSESSATNRFLRLRVTRP